MSNLHPKGATRERILAFGPSGTGKSSAYLSIARKCPDSTFYVLDSDFAIERMLENENLPNVTHRLVTDWEGYVEGTKEFQKLMKPDDWLVIDFISTAWEAVQGYYIEQIHGKDMDSFFLEARKKKAKGNPLEGDTDWGVINKLYKAWMNILLANTPGHIFCTAQAKAIGDRDDAAVKQTYAIVGSRPEGQKNLAHSMHTVLLMGRVRMGEYHLTTVKDRARKEVEKLAIGETVGFAGAYLMPIAGWRPA